MMASKLDVQHLVCEGCDDHPTAARIDGQLHLVCHCTHVDGEIDAVPITGGALPPDRWAFNSEHGGVAE